MTNKNEIEETDNMSTFTLFVEPKISFLDKLFPDGIASYRAGYVVFHPKIIFNEIGHQIKWAWQRVFRGWDDRVIWGIDHYLAKMIPLWVEKLREDKYGIPISVFDSEDWDEEKCEYIEGAELKAQDKYDKILLEIIDGFNAYTQISEESLWIDDPDYKNLKEEFENGIRLFVQHFETLWD